MKPPPSPADSATPSCARAPLLATITLLAGAVPGLANNLSIGDVRLIDAGGGMADIEFTMAWENSWHESWTEAGGTIQVTNWDAVWVFAKFRQNGGLWQHVQLAAAGHGPTGGTVIEVAEDGGARLGAFVHRAATGRGDVSCPAMRLRWDLAAQGVPSADDLDITLLGVEMVYIPEGSFDLGSGGTEAAAFHTAPDPAVPYRIASEAAFDVGGDPGDLAATSELHAGAVPAGYPKGFAAFYCMKYEVTEGQYVDFLNLLDPGIVAPYFPGQAGNWRHTISAAAGGGFESAAPDRACGYFSMVRALGYLDWAGLRPMTEMEFEKACRGPRAPWVNEFAWGDTTLVGLEGFVGVDGSGTETADPPAANAHSNTSPIGGPVRAGIFATDSSTRATAGAGYYGVMELSGNLLEFVVNARDETGSRGFDGTHGDGDEYTDPLAVWPGSSYWHYGGRGGSVADRTNFDRFRTSDRAYAVSPYSSSAYYNGARGVRSAP